MKKEKKLVDKYWDLIDYCKCKNPDFQFSREVTVFDDKSEEWGYYYCGTCGKQIDERE